MKDLSDVIRWLREIEWRDMASEDSATSAIRVLEKLELPPAHVAPYYLIERQIDGSTHWLSWPANKLKWLPDARLADRYSWAIAAERDCRAYNSLHPQWSCVVTEHVDLPLASPPEPK